MDKKSRIKEVDFLIKVTSFLWKLSSISKNNVKIIYLKFIIY